MAGVTTSVRHYLVILVSVLCACVCEHIKQRCDVIYFLAVGNSQELEKQCCGVPLSPQMEVAAVGTNHETEVHPKEII